MPRSAYNDFVAQYARTNRPTNGWKKGQLMTEAGAAWRASGHSPKVRSRSECVGKQQSSCLPPCSWARGAKRQYCRKSVTKKTHSPSLYIPPSVKKREILAPALHSCIGLGQDPCDVAPNCYWQPSNKRCVTRSGKAVKQMYQSDERQSMLAQIRGRPQ